MVSQIKVNEIIKQSGSSISIGESGDTVDLSNPTSVTLNSTMENTPAFQCFRASNQTIAASTYVKIEFDTEDYDTDGCYNNTSGTVTLNGISTHKQ